MRAGFGTANISPQPPVYLAGFGARTQPAERVHEDLEARALYLKEDGTRFCLVVCDLLGMSPSYSHPVRRAIADELGVGIGHVLVACTHTHSGPSTIAGTDAIGWPNPDGYADVLRDGCVRATIAARDAARDARLSYVRAPLPQGFAFNRRGLPFDEPWFGVLDVAGTERIGTVTNLPIHPVLLGPQWLAVAPDWVGPFRRALETFAGGTAIELTGALGDINPTPPEGVPASSYEPWASEEQTNEYGKRLATVVAEALPGTQLLPSGLRLVREETLDVPVGETPIAAMAGAPSLRVELVEWQIGDVRLVSIPGEAFHLLGREISASRGDRVLLAGISPSWAGYFPHPWGDGYEEGVSYGEGFVRIVREALTAPT
jgi:neutral ceramidase